VSDGAASCNAAATVGAGSCSLTSTSAGAKTLTATFTEDANFLGSSDTEAHTVNKASTTTTITSDAPDPSVVGEPYLVQWTVVVNAPGAGVPTGTMTVTGGSGCTVPVGDAQCSITSTAAGPVTLTATYGGDTNFDGSSDTEA